MNIDTVRTTDAIVSLVGNLQINEIDIACIQNTQNSRNGYIAREDYAIFFSGGDNENNGKEINKPIRAGVAISIKTSWGNNIIQVQSRSRRFMGI